MVTEVLVVLLVEVSIEFYMPGAAKGVGMIGCNVVLIGYDLVNEKDDWKVRRGFTHGI